MRGAGGDHQQRTKSCRGLGCGADVRCLLRPAAVQDGRHETARLSEVPPMRHGVGFNSCRPLPGPSDRARQTGLTQQRLPVLPPSNLAQDTGAALQWAIW